MNYLFNYAAYDVEKYEACRNLEVYIVENSNMKDYLVFQDNVLKAGGVKEQCNEIRDNIFATYSIEGKQLHVYYTGNDKKTRIIVDKESDLPIDSVVAMGQNCSLYQFELDYRNIDCGMCYIFETGGGRFFIIDSAHMNSVNDHVRLYEFLKKINKNPKGIVIAGWLLTHGHQDHIVKFMDFVNAGYEDVIIESVYSGFPRTDIRGSESWKEEDKITMREFEQFNDSHNWKKIRLHTGQHQKIDELEMTVLFTFDDICEEPLEGYNDSSTVFIIEARGTKCIFLGDSNIRSSCEAVARFGHSLKSDILQVAHHGINGSNVGIYYMIQAPTAMFPTAERYLSKRMDSEANQAVKRLSSEIFVAAEGTYRFAMPYSVGNAAWIGKEIQEN